MMPGMTPKKVQWSRRRKPVLAAVVVAAALGLGAVMVTLGGSSGGSDDLTAAETTQRSRNFTGRISLPLVDPIDTDKALASMALDVQAEAALTADVNAGRAHLAWLSVWDDQAQDGDRIRVSAGGFDLDLDLYNAPHRIGIPIADENPGLTIMGLHDGGGGITIGIQTTNGVVLTPVLRPGQLLPIGLR